MRIVIKNKLRAFAHQSEIERRKRYFLIMGTDKCNNFLFRTFGMKM